MVIPLTIQISCEKGIVDADNRDLGENKIFENVFGHVNACSSRWEDVTFNVPSTIISLLRGSRQGAPNLKVLRVHTTDGPEFCFNLEKRVQPHSMAFGCYPFTWDELNVNWKNLVDVHLAKFDAFFCVLAIQQMPRLIRCSLVDVRDEIRLEELATDERIVHQNLQELTYTSRRTGYEEESLFEYFIFPSLTQLRIIYWAGSNKNPLFLWENSIKPFILQSSFQLTLLDLQLPCELGSLVETLTNIAYLQKLDLKDCFEEEIHRYHSFLVHLANTFLRGVVNRDTSLQEFLPNLESFSYTGSLEVIDSRPEFVWTFDAFGPFSERQNQLKLRPLKHIMFRPHNGASWSHIHIDTDDLRLRRIFDLTDIGIIIQLMNYMTGEDYGIRYGIRLRRSALNPWVLATG